MANAVGAPTLHSPHPVHRGNRLGRPAGNDRLDGPPVDLEVRRLLFGLVVEFGYVVAGFDRNVSGLAILSERWGRVNFKMDHAQLGQLVEHVLRDLRLDAALRCRWCRGRRPVVRRWVSCRISVLLADYSSRQRTSKVRLRTKYPPPIQTATHLAETRRLSRVRTIRRMLGRTSGFGSLRRNKLPLQ
jgi:hypothetical protein